MTFQEIEVVVTHVANKGSIELVVRADEAPFLMCHPADRETVDACLAQAREQDVGVALIMQERGGYFSPTDTPRDMR